MQILTFPFLESSSPTTPVPVSLTQHLSKPRRNVEARRTRQNASYQISIHRRLETTPRASDRAQDWPAKTEKDASRTPFGRDQDRSRAA